MHRRTLMSVAVMAAALACTEGDARQRGPLTVLPARPDEPPRLLNGELPFRYPASLYARRVQGNVTLQLVVSADGRPVSDSTRVVESSGHAAMDSSALAGADQLRFIPARRRGQAMAVAVLFPVYFRHPEAPPLPGDTVLRPPQDSAGHSPPLLP
jgi:TonB family protein